jgi:hypothetical protein
MIWQIITEMILPHSSYHHCGIGVVGIETTLSFKTSTVAYLIHFILVEAQN